MIRENNQRAKNGFDLIKEGLTVDLRNLKYLSETDHLNCPICQQPFLSPMTTACGHTFCKECIEECFKAYKTSDETPKKGACPLDRTTIDASDINDLFPAPLIITNMVDDLRVGCLNEERGCTWNGHRWEIDRHVFDECGYTRVYCNGIRSVESSKVKGETEEDQNDSDKNTSDKNTDELSKDIQHHCKILTEKRFLEGTDGECVHKEFSCDLCNEQITKITQQSHLDQSCSENYIKCDVCNNDMIQRKNLEKHRTNCLKSGKFVCTANEIGCTWSGDTEPSLENHLQNGNCQLNQLFPYIKKLEMEISDVVDENKVLKKQINSILDGIVQGKVTNLGYNQHIEEIGSFARDLDQDMLVNVNYEVERLRSELDEKVYPFISRESSEISNRLNVINNLVNDSFLMKDEMNLQRTLLNSVRKQVQFIMFRNRNPAMFTGNVVPDYEEPNFDLSSRSSSEERLNLKL